MSSAPILSITQLPTRRSASPAATVRRLERQHDRLEKCFTKDMVALSLEPDDRKRRNLMLRAIRHHDQARFCYMHLMIARRELFA